MVIVSQQRFLWHDKLVFFPSTDDFQKLHDELSSNGLLRIVQSSQPLPRGSHLIRSGTFTTSCIDLANDADQILAQMAKKTRQYIRGAAKLLDRMEILRNQARSNRDFLTLYNDFAGLKGYAYPMSARRFRAYLAVSDVWVLYYDGRPIVGRLTIPDAKVGRAVQVMMGTARLNNAEDARLSGILNRYLTWHEILAYKERGFALYDLGGISDGTSTIAKFKLSFGGSWVQDLSYIYAGWPGKLAYKMYEARLHATRYFSSRGKQQPRQVSDIPRPAS
jgi:hypothetical protein